MPDMCALQVYQERLDPVLPVDKSLSAGSPSSPSADIDLHNCTDCLHADMRIADLLRVTHIRAVLPADKSLELLPSTHERKATCPTQKHAYSAS